jgi:hypothetical protein
VRTLFSGGKTAGDEIDDYLRFSAGSVRLAAGRPDDGAPFKDYYPVATLDPKGVAVHCRIDDFLFADLAGNRTIDFVFVVDKDHLIAGDAGKLSFADGTFIEVKRYGQVDLSGKKVESGPPPVNPDKQSVFRKPLIQNAIAKMEPAALPAGASGAVATDNSAKPQAGKALGDTGLTFQDAAVSSQLFSPVDVKSADTQGPVRLTSGVGGDFKGRKWVHLNVSADTNLKDLAGAPETAISALAPASAANVIVQIHCLAPTGGSDQHMWYWAANLAHFVVADANGRTFKCVGGWARVSRPNAERVLQDFMVANYQQLDDQGALEPIEAPVTRSRPTDVWLAFEVPTGTVIGELRFNDTTVLDGLNLKAQ